MIEEHRLPIPLRVTTDAFLAKSRLMYVVFLVAGVTIGGSPVLVQLSFVTGFAFGSKVSAEQQVLGV